LRPEYINTFVDSTKPEQIRLKQINCKGRPNEATMKLKCEKE